MNARVFLVVAVAVILLFKNAETPGAFLRHQVGGQGFAAGWEVVSLDIVSKFEPTILCDIRSWDYTTFPGHFDMVWASAVCAEYSRALTRPRRLLKGDALVLSALEIIAHFDPLMWVIENPATGLLKTRPFMERLRPWVDVTYCKYGTPYRKQTRLWTNMPWSLYSVPAALCKEIARAATEELAERLSIPD